MARSKTYWTPKLTAVEYTALVCALDLAMNSYKSTNTNSLHDSAQLLRDKLVANAPELYKAYGVK